MGKTRISKRKEKKKRLIWCAKLCHRAKTKEGKPFFLNVNNLQGKILSWKLITLKEMDLNGLCPKKSFTFGREQDL